MVKLARMAATFLLGVAAVAMASGGDLDAAALSRATACQAPQAPPLQQCRILASEARGAVARSMLRGGSNPALAEAEAALRAAASACAAGDVWAEAAQLTREAAEIAGARAQRGALAAPPPSPNACAIAPQGVLFDAFSASRRRVALLARAPAQVCPASLGGDGARTLKAAVQTARHAECAWLMDAAAERGEAGAAALEADERPTAMLALSAALNALNVARPICAAAPRRRVDAARETLADVITALRDDDATGTAHAARVRATLPPRPSPLRMEALADSLARSAPAACGQAGGLLRPTTTVAAGETPASNAAASTKPTAEDAATTTNADDIGLRGAAGRPTLRR